MRRIGQAQFCLLFLLAFIVEGRAAEHSPVLGPRGGPNIAAKHSVILGPRHLLNTRFPEIKFENVTLREAMGFLSRGAEVNIVIDPAVYASAAASAAPSFPRNASPRPASLAASPATPDETRITLHLKNVPLGVALKYILRYKNLRYIVDDYAIVIVPIGIAMPEDLVTEVFRLRTGDIGSAAFRVPLAVSR